MPKLGACINLRYLVTLGESHIFVLAECQAAAVRTETSAVICTLFRDRASGAVLPLHRYVQGIGSVWSGPELYRAVGSCLLRGLFSGHPQSNTGDNQCWNDAVDLRRRISAYPVRIAVYAPEDHKNHLYEGEDSTRLHYDNDDVHVLSCVTFRQDTPMLVGQIINTSRNQKCYYEV